MTIIPINTYDKMKVGDRGCGTCHDMNMNEVHVAIEVLEVIDKEIYLKEIQELGLMHHINRSVHDPMLNFYRVRILD